MKMLIMKNLQNCLQKMRTEEDMCDIHVVSNEGTKHPAHSLVLAAVSPVFKVMVTKDFKEFQSKEIKLPGVDNSLLKTILDFIYTGDLEMTNENALDLFMITDRLEIECLFTSCISYIKDHVDISNCLGVLRIAEQYNQKDLQEHATIFLLRHFQQLAGTDGFLDLTVAELTTMLSRDELNVEKEEYLIDFVIRWVDHDASRKNELENVMKHLRYPMMNFDFIEGKFRGHPRWKENKSMQRLVKSVYKGCFQIFQRTSTDPDTTLKCLNVRFRVPSQIIFLCGGWNRGRTLDTVECFNSKTGFWSEPRNLVDDLEGRSYFGIEYFKGKVYVFGGYNGRSYLNTVRCFDPNTKTWSSITPMHNRRCFTSCAAIGDDLYVIAGFDGQHRLTSVEKYSTATKEWTLMKSLAIPRSDAATVVHNGQIYIFGGYAGESLDTSEVYDQGTDTWHNLMHMQVKRSGSSAVSIPEENKILVLGGYDGTSRVCTIEYYDPETNNWSFGPSMSQERSNFATCVMDNKLYVIGGYTGKTTLKDVEIYDFRTRVWQFGQPIVKSGRSAMKAVCLDNISDHNAYFPWEKYPPIRMNGAFDHQSYELDTMEGGDEAGGA